MTQDAQNKNTQDLTWSKVFSDAPGPQEAPETDTDEAVIASLAETAAITGEYWALDDLLQRQDASVSGNSVGTGSFKASGAAYVKAYGDVDLIAIGQSRVHGSGYARISAGQNATIVATEHAKVTASGKVAVCATGAARIYASDDVIVAALDRCEVYASGRVKIKAFGSSTVYASGDSVVEVDYPTGCTVFLYGNARQVVVTPKR